jgi:hypothetical protein
MPDCIDPNSPVTNADLQVAMREMREFIAEQLSRVKNPEEWLTVQECAAHLQIHRETLLRTLQESPISIIDLRLRYRPPTAEVPERTT